MEFPPVGPEVFQLFSGVAQGDGLGIRSKAGVCSPGVNDLMRPLDIFRFFGGAGELPAAKEDFTVIALLSELLALVEIEPGFKMVLRVEFVKQSEIG